jgi:assimilatory nitrate reductase catalytic subunit
LFGEGGFATEDGRARFVPTVWRAPARVPDARFPLLLNTGRVRDQWHTMRRTGLVPKLLQHVAEPVASIHPDDAEALGIPDRGLACDLVRLETEHASAVLRAALDPGQRRGEVFVPMHWSDQFASAGPVVRLVGAACDPVSGQPELKATPVRATPVPTAWRGLLLHAGAVLPQGPVWSRVPLEHGHAFDLAGTEPLPEAVDAFARSLMQADPADLLAMADPARGVWRFAALSRGQVIACLYLTTGADGLPSSQALSALLAGTVPDACRVAVLAGGGGLSRGTLVCACFSVGLEPLRVAITQRRLTSVAEIGRSLQAGTNCGSCIPELKKLLREQEPVF